jgi:hypothetical protein
MTDLEIDKALALAIGYKLFDVKFHDDMRAVAVFRGSWRVFDHRDWNVIGPIAEKYNMFPYRLRITEERGYWNVLPIKTMWQTPRRRPLHWPL